MTTIGATTSATPSAKALSPWDLPRSILLAAAWWGLLTGFIKTTCIFGFYELRTVVLLHVSQFAWYFPIGEAIWGLALGLPFFLWALWGGVTTTLRAVVMFLFGFACAASSIITIGRLEVARLQIWAVMVLSLGVAVQAARWARDRPAIIHRLMVVSARLMVCSTVLLCATIEGRIWWVQRQLLSTLPDASSGAPNVLLIVLDTVRAQSLSIYGYHAQTTPNLQKWASEGVTFDEAITSAPFTLTSHASMFTGRYPTELDADWCRPLGNKYPTLAQVLHDHGYITVGVAANCQLLGWQTGLDRGFACYHAHVFEPLHLLMESVRLDVSPPMMRASDVNSYFVNWLASSYDDSHPFFAFLNYIDCHSPYHSTASRGSQDQLSIYTPLQKLEMAQMNNYDQKRQKLVVQWCARCFKTVNPPANTAMIELSRQAYDSAIFDLDGEVHALLTNLKMQGSLRNTLVVIVADHGEQFGEHGLVQHADSVYHPAVHIPLIIIPPNCAVAGRRIEQIVTLRDIPATILDLLNIHGTAIAGESFAAALGPDPSFRLPDGPKFIYINKGIHFTAWHPNARSPVQAVVLEGKEYITNDRTHEMYDFIGDPTEQHDLIDSPAYSSLVARCQQLLADHDAQGRQATLAVEKSP